MTKFVLCKDITSFQIGCTCKTQIQFEQYKAGKIMKQNIHKTNGLKKLFVGASLSRLGITPTSITLFLLKRKCLGKFNMTK